MFFRSTLLKSFFLTALLMGFFSFGRLVLADGVLTDNFDSYSLGNVNGQGSWVHYVQNYNQVTSAEFFSSTRSLTAQNNSAYSIDYINFTATSSGFLSFKIKVNSTVGFPVSIKLSATANDYSSINFGDSGTNLGFKIVAQTSTTTITLFDDVPFSEWHNIIYNFNATTNVQSVSLNGITSATFPRYQNYSSINRMYIYNGDTGYFFDDFGSVDISTSTSPTFPYTPSAWDLEVFNPPTRADESYSIMTNFETSLVFGFIFNKPDFIATSSIVFKLDNITATGTVLSNYRTASLSSLTSVTQSNYFYSPVTATSTPYFYRAYLQYLGQTFTDLYFNVNSSVTGVIPNFNATPDAMTEICGTSGLIECAFRKAIRWAFVPSESAFTDFLTVKDDLMLQAPFGYWTLARQGLEQMSVGSSTAPTLSINADIGGNNTELKLIDFEQTKNLVGDSTMLLIYNLMKYGIYLSLVFYVFFRINKMFTA